MDINTCTKVSGDYGDIKMFTVASFKSNQNSQSTVSYPKLGAFLLEITYTYLKYTITVLFFQL